MSGGVALVPPPLERIPAISDAIAKAVMTLPAGVSGALIGVANSDGANVAIVQRVNDRFVVTAWVGKHWGGDLDYGAAAKVTW